MDLQKICSVDSDLALPFAFIRMKNVVEPNTYLYMGIGFDITGKCVQFFYCTSDGNIYICYDFNTQ